MAEVIVIRFALCIALALVLAGCASTPPTQTESPPDSTSLRGEVSGAPIEPAVEDRYQGKADVRFDQPFPFPENAVPSYPEALLAARLPPITLTVRLIISEAGTVSKISPLTAVAPEQEAFLASLQTTLLSWQFLPLVEISEGPGQTMITAHGINYRYDGQAKALPFHQDYAFVFRQQDGKGSVNSELRH